ncbi:winged helix-turn-helix domain-containing protein [Vulcanisaeta thermophila]|uniref:winged helix-turn-helix domain-containing protein n=1 Tax=Vulcanisaeta thermophila TaxID=867917 RepID=UPI000853E874|nr:winged helix-turn-helix domain-containing protein [Vulcanisaeta thermophila]
MIRVNVGSGGMELLRINTKSVVILPVESFNTLVSNDIRLKIMNLLSRGPMTVTTIAHELGMLKGVAHRHVKILKDNGWVRILTEEEVRALGLNREANRIYYAPSAIVFLSYRLEDVGRTVRIVVPASYSAFVDLRGGKFILMMPSATTHCASQCPTHELCLDWVKRIAKQYHVVVDSDDAGEALVQLYTQLVLKELRMQMMSSVMSLESSKLNSIYIKHAKLVL